MIMKRIRLLYEQIEEAKRLMMRGTLLHVRLALILLDNAAELIMYRELAHQFAWDDSFGLPPPNVRVAGIEYPPGPSYSAVERRRAEEEFRPKLKLLSHNFGKMSSKQAAILLVCHQMRNDAFHREVMNPAILGPTTDLLFLTVAELAREFPVHTYSISAGNPTGETAEFMERFGLERVDEFGDENVKEKIYRKLIEGMAFSWSLPRTLSDDLVERIDEIIDGLAYLNDGDSDRNKLDHGLRYTQFWRERGAEVMRRAHEEDRVPKDDIDRAYVEWSESPGPRFTMDTIERQRRHASAIAKGTHPADALVRYSAIEKWMGPLEEDVHQSVRDFDNHIDMLVEERILERVFTRGPLKP
jgi:hypothetical protein